MRMMLRGAVLAIFLAGCCPSTATSDSIAFVSDLHGDWEIFVMNANGTNVRQLTDNDDWDDWPVWSPDGESIAFSSDRDGDSEIFVMNADGTNVVSTGQRGYMAQWVGPND